MKNEAEAGRVIEKYADTVRRICFIHLHNYNDVEDVFQDVFLKYILYDKPFENEEHERAWLIRVAINACKDVFKSFFRQKVCSLEEVDREPLFIQDESRGVLEAVLKLPEHYKNVIYLFYYEGYSAVEIAKMLGRKENTIYTWLSRARSELKERLGGDYFDE